MSQGHVFNVLPEIWELMIIPHLSSNDFLAVINSAPQWRWMLKSKTVSELLPLVLPVLFKHWSLSVESLLAWRGVNKVAKSVVDEILEESSSAKAYYERLTTRGAEWSPSVEDENHPLRSVVDTITNRYNLRSSRTLRKFLIYAQSRTEIGATANDIFPTKGVQLSIVDTPLMGINDLSMTLLNGFGDIVSSATFHILNGSAELILPFLAKLINLRVLKLKGRMLSVAMQRPIPPFEDIEPLNQLELLDVEEFKDLHHGEIALCPYLFRLCPQLKTLICNGLLFENQMNVQNLIPEYLPSVERLRVKRVKCRHCHCSAVPFAPKGYSTCR